MSLDPKERNRGPAPSSPDGGAGMERRDPDARTTPDTKCFVCGDTLVFMFMHHDSLHRTSDREYAIYRCDGCGLLKILPEPTAEEIASFYPDEYYSYRIESGMGRIARMRERLKDEVLDLHYGMRGDSPCLRILARSVRNYMTRVSVSGIPLHPPRYNGRFLDIGCGDGYWVHKLRKYGWDCTGVEFVGEEKDGIRVGGFMDMEFEDGFEFIRLNHVLEHVKNTDAYLVKMRSLLCEEGELYVAVPNSESIFFKIFGRYWYALETPRHLHVFNEGNLRRLLHRNGLEIRSLSYESRYSLGNSLTNYLNVKTLLKIKDEHMLIGFVLSPADKLLGWIGPGDLINVTTGRLK